MFAAVCLAFNSSQSKDRISVDQTTEAEEPAHVKCGYAHLSVMCLSQIYLP